MAVAPHAPETPETPGHPRHLRHLRHLEINSRHVVTRHARLRHFLRFLKRFVAAVLPCVESDDAVDQRVLDRIGARHRQPRSARCASRAGSAGAGDITCGSHGGSRRGLGCYGHLRITSDGQDVVSGGHILWRPARQDPRFRRVSAWADVGLRQNRCVGVGRLQCRIPAGFHTARTTSHAPATGQHAHGAARSDVG